MIRAVLDTNVLASAAAGEDRPASIPGALLRAWREERYELVLSTHILDELQRALSRSYFRARSTPEQATAFLTALMREAILVPITVDVRGAATHPEDDLILATAASARAEYLVTGDLKLRRLERFMNTTIVLPSEFMEILH